MLGFPHFGSAPTAGARQVAATGGLRRGGWFVWIAIALVALMALGSARYWRGVAGQPGLDFYEYWGSGKAQRESGYRLGSPYRAAARYQAQLQRMAQASGDPLLAAAIAMRPAPDMIGTPLLYYLFSSLPENYSTALWAHRAAQLAAFLAAVFLLVYGGTGSWLCALAFAPLLALAFDPLLLDLAVANLNSIQLFFLVLAAGLIERWHQGAARISGASATSVSCLLVLLSLMKPDVAGAGLLLECSLLLAAPRRVRLAAVGVSFAAAVFLLALPCLLFGSWTVWNEWLAQPFLKLQQMQGLVSRHNGSIVSMLFRRFDVSPAIGTRAVGAFLLLSAAAAVALPAPGAGRLAGGARLSAAARAVLGQPHICLGAGLFALIVPLPAVWSHYQVLLLAPALWVLCHGSAPPLARGLALLSVLLFADLARRLYQLAGGLPWIEVEWMHVLAWVPAWAALCMCMRRAVAGGLASAKPAGPLPQAP